MKSPVYFADKRCFEVPFICTSNGTGRNRQGSESFLRFLYECHPEAVSAAEGPMHSNGSEPHGAKQVPVRLLPCGQSLRAGSPLSWTACVASHPASVGMTLNSKGFSYFFLEICSPNRFSCSRSSGVRFAPKSSGPNTGRISTSSPPSKGARFSHSTASSIDRTCQIQ